MCLLPRTWSSREDTDRSCFLQGQREGDAHEAPTSGAKVKATPKNSIVKTKMKYFLKVKAMQKKKKGKKEKSHHERNTKVLNKGEITRQSLWKYRFVIVQSTSHVQLFVTPTLCNPHVTPCNYSTPGSSVLHCLPEFALIHVHWVGDAIYLILCCPLLLLPSIFPSIRVFSNELAFHVRWPKYWSFSISPSKKYSGLISFKINWTSL